MENTDFAAVQFGAAEDPPEGVEDVIGIVVLEKIEVGKGRAHMVQHGFHLSGRGRQPVGGRHLASPGGDPVDLVETDIDRLGQVQRGQFAGGRDGDEMVAAVELLVGQSLVLAAEKQAATAIGIARRYPFGRLIGSHEGLPVALAETPGGAEQQIEIGHGAIQIRENQGLFEDMTGLHRHQPRRFAEMVGKGGDQAQFVAAEVQHGPADRADIQGALGFDQDYGESFLAHRRILGMPNFKSITSLWGNILNGFRKVPQPTRRWR